MKNFDLEMENTPLFVMADASSSLLTFAMKQRLMDQAHPSQVESVEHMAERKSKEFEDKLEMLDKRLNRGWQLIASKLKK